MAGARPREGISLKRTIYLCFCLLLYLTGTALLCVQGSLALGGILCVGSVAFLMALCIISILLHERREGKILYKETSYRYLFFLSVIAWGVVLGFSFFEPYAYPALLMGMIFSAFGGDILALSLGLYLDLVYCLSLGLSGFYTAIYVGLTVCGVLLSRVLREQKRFEKISSLLMILALTVGFAAVAGYFTDLRLPLRTLIIAGTVGFFEVLYSLLVLPRLDDLIHHEEYVLYETLLDPAYSLIVELRSFSEGEYQRAQKVSRLARECGEEIGVNAKLCTAGGLYYRIGKMMGEPEINHAVKIASRHNFPKELTNILYEYEAVLKKPSSEESAIVHMCDALVKKVEAFAASSDSMESSWNQEMVIYQTLNELSSLGIYDDSSISMNQFLKIRNRLVREGSLV